jgi:hypothetical protein
VGSLVWKVLGTGGAILAGIVARKVTWTGWKVATGNEPPANPEDPEVEWKEALGFAVFSGAVVGLARLLTTKKAADFYTKSAGHLPKDLQKKIDKANAKASA